MNLKSRLPMFLTGLRFVLVAPFIYFLLLDRKETVLISLIIYLIASITDWFDGYFARKFNVVSDLGAFLDPLADKILTLSAFVIFSLKNYIFLPFYLVIIMFFREYFVTMMRVEIDTNKKRDESEKSKKFVTSKEAKFKTALQMFTIIIFYLFYGFNKNFIPKIYILSEMTYLPLILFSISLVLAYYSSVKYVANYADSAFQTLSKTIATFFYSGYIPFASGTFASLIILAYFLIFKPTFVFLLIEIVILFISGTYFSTKLEKRLMVKDPSIIVIDEVVGMLICFVPYYFVQQILLFYNSLFNIDSQILNRLINLTNSSYFFISVSLILFLLFRLFDIFKPFIIKKVEKISGGLGIMIDDIIAAIFTQISFLVLSSIGLFIYIKFI